MHLTVIDSGGVEEGSVKSQEPTLWHNQDGTVSAFVYSGGGDHWLHFPGIGRYRLSGRSEEITVIADPAARQDIVEDTYHRIVVPMRLQQKGDEVLHASAVIIRGNVITLCASSGTGKSTTAYALRCRGYRIWSDDVISFHICDERVQARPLPFRVRLRQDAVRYFDIDNPELYSKSPSSVRFEPANEAVPFGLVIVLDRIADSSENTGISRLSPEESFRAVLSHAWCFSLDDPERNRLMMDTYLKLIARIPVFRIRFKTGFKNLDLLLNDIESVVRQSIS